MIWWIISVPFLLLAIALCLPITLTLSATSNPDLVVEGSISWALWRFKHFRFKPAVASDADTTAAPKPAPSKVAKEKPTAEPKQATAKPKTREKLKQQDRPRLPWQTIQQLLRKYLATLWRALHLRCLHGDFYLAIDDPASYGWLFGFLEATHLLRPPLHLRLELSTNVVFHADMKLRSRLYPIQWLWLALRIGFEPDVRSLWWNQLFKKGEKKRARSQSIHRAAGKPNIQQDRNRRSYHSG